MRIFTKRADLDIAEVLSAPCPDCPKCLLGGIMTELGEDELDIIVAYPLGDSLKNVRGEVSKLLELQGNMAVTASVRSNLFEDVSNSLLSVLWASKVAKCLESRVDGYSLRGDITIVSKGTIPYLNFLPLAQAVADKKDDVYIWNAVIAFIRSTLPYTRRSFEPSIDKTPLSPVSQNGCDQEKNEAEERLRQEIHYDTFPEVEGFDAKYFHGRNWDGDAKQVWELAKGEHDGTRWTTLSDQPTRRDLERWVFRFQQNFLTDRRGVHGTYYTDTPEAMLSENLEYELDLFAEDANFDPEIQHNWKGIAVVGEMRRTGYSGIGPVLQLSWYARSVFAHQPARLFVHGFTLVGTQMEAWVFDRSGPYSGGKFDIHEDPTRFVQIFCGYLMMNDAELGFDALPRPRVVDSQLTIQLNQDLLYLRTPPIAFQRAIVCRGTTCYLAKKARTDDYNLVLKLSWAPKKRSSEIILLEKAGNCGVTGLPSLVSSCEVNSISALRIGLTFPRRLKFHPVHETCSTTPPFQNPLTITSQSAGPSTSKKSKPTDEGVGQSKSSKKPKLNNMAGDDKYDEYDDAPFEDRALRIMVTSPAGRPIKDFKDIPELLECLRDAVKAHQSLFEDGNILHRDISANNIIITDPKSPGDPRGMIIDLDLAKERDTRPSGTRHRTGTMEFMAIGVLRGTPHTYRHDLESFVYILIWLCIQKGWELEGTAKKMRKSTMLRRWYISTYREIAMSKVGAMLPDGINIYLDEFHAKFECVKPLCRKLIAILCPLRSTGLYTDTPRNPKDMYKKMIGAFDEELKKIRRDGGGFL